jgi:hypothetical protein
LEEGGWQKGVSVKRHRTKWLGLAIPGCLLLQISACVGDPNYFLVNLAAQWVTSSIVRTLFSLLPGI